MFFNNSDDDPYGDIRRREEYERQQQANFAKGLGHFFLKMYMNVLIYMATYLAIAILLTELLNVHQALAMIISMIVSFFVFKLEYVKYNKLKSLMTIAFLIGLEFVALGSLNIS